MKKILSAFIALVIVNTLPVGAQTSDVYYTALVNSNIREEPTTTARRIGSLSKGAQIRVTGEAAGGNWYSVQLDDGKRGFIYAKLLKEGVSSSRAAPEPTTCPSTGEKANLVGGPSPAPEDACAYIIWPHDGERIPGGEFSIQFGLRKAGVAPAGVEKEFTGHHHLLINTDLPPLDEAIPSDDNHIHFGRGQTEYFVQLPKGRHTLQLLLADHNHVPHTPPVFSRKITIIVP